MAKAIKKEKKKSSRQTFGNHSTKAPKNVFKDKAKVETEKLKLKIGELQDILYAQGKYSVLVIIQGMDASGKDGAVKNVFEAVNPAGCRVIGFKKPSDEEMKHDFLWRIHKAVPERGMIHIFNRSQYEDVLIQRVHKWIDETTVKQRFEQINNFEKMLVDNNSIVLKFMLNVSNEMQLIRLEERLSDPTKYWKHNENDMQERDFWNDYMNAYNDVLKHCSKPVEWTIVPSDQNWYKEYVICKKIYETLKNLNLQYPAIPKK
jgi:PPK2 family polyphosphate:nucleotide phosphotransferase